MSQTVSGSDLSDELERLRAQLLQSEARLAEARRIAQIGYCERDLDANPDDAAMVLAVIAMAHAMRLKVIAEGVETEAQLQFLQTNACDQIQGYFFSRPLDGPAVTAFLRERQRGIPA